MLAAAVLAMRGAMQIAGPLFVLGLGMFSNVGAFVKNGAFWKKAEGQKSKVRTSIIEMELDHDTGTMSGTVLAGPLKGRKLFDLVDGELSQLHAQCASAADQSMALLEAWLQRNRPGYHDDGQQERQPCFVIRQDDAGKRQSPYWAWGVIRHLRTSRPPIEIS